MVDRAEVDAMAAIMGKLGNAVESGATPAQPNRVQHEDPASEAAQIDAMADVLRKLEASTASASQQIVTESKTKPDLGFAVQAERTTTGVAVARYEIVTEKKTVSEGLNKNFYHIQDNKTHQRVYEDLGLFESAMGIVKHLLYTKDNNRINRIVNNDAAYLGCMTEAYAYKKRMQRLDESSVQHDVAHAKYSNAMTRVKQAKMKILSCL